MTEIEINSEWTVPTYASTTKSVVRGFFTDMAGIDRVVVEALWVDGAITVTAVPRALFLEEYAPVEPFFEVGKTYKFAGSGGLFRYLVTKIEEFDGRKYARTERTGGDVSRLVYLDVFGAFEEVGNG